MPGAEALFQHARASITRRFGSASARYRLALSSGFVIAAVGMATVVIGQSGQAQDLFGALGSLFGVPQAEAPQAETVVRRHYAETSRPRRHRLAERERGAGYHRRVLDSHEDGAPMRLGRASICVRSCDGFAFPVGTFHGEGDIAAHEATCRSECPGAQTALYVLPNGSSSIDEAVDVHSGQTYSQKASGFHYTTYLDESCSCHPQGGNRISSLLRDFTLRRGDAVVTNTGVKVFHGGGHFPYRQADFIRLAESRDVKQASLTSFRAIERAALTSNHPAVAQAFKPPASAPAASLKALDHQASLQQPTAP